MHFLLYFVTLQPNHFDLTSHKFGLTDGGDMRRIKFIFREPAQHAGLPNPRVSEHEQPE